MSWPGVTPHTGYFISDPCAFSVTTVSATAIVGTPGACLGSGLTYVVTFTLSGTLGANETLELWQEIYKDAEGAPGLTYNNTLGRFTSSPINNPPGWNVATSASDGPGTSHDYKRTAEIRVVPISSVAGSGITCASDQDTDTTTAAECTL